MQRRLSTTKIATALIAIPTTTLVDKDGESNVHNDDNDLGRGSELWLSFDEADGVFEHDRGSKKLDKMDVVDGVVDGIDGGGREADEVGCGVVVGGVGHCSENSIFLNY